MARSRIFSVATLQGVVFFCLAVLFLLIYLLPAIRQYNVFWLQAFDYGIIYNSTQELAFGRPAFMTTRGVHVWGDSQDYFQLLFAPLHYLPAPHYWLIGAHSVAIWSCGVFCFFYLRPHRLVALLVPLVVWMSPYLINSSNDLFHTESYATILHLLVFYAAVRGRRGLFWGAVLLVLACKEDIAIYVAWFMVLAFFRPDIFRIERRHLAGAVAAAVAVFVINQSVVQPYYKLQTCEWLGTPVTMAAVRATPSPWFPDIWTELLRPAYYARVLLPEVPWYLLMLLWPVVFFPRAAFPMIFLPLAGAAINVLGSGYLLKSTFHYDHSSYAAVIIVMLIGLSRIKRKNLVAIVLFAVALGIHLYWPHMRARVTRVWNGEDNLWAFKKDERTVFSERLNALLPPDTVVSADYGTVNYLLRGRSQAFMFENPFRPDYFAIYDLCDGDEKPLPGLPPVDLVVLRADYRPLPSGQASLAPFDHYQASLFDGKFPMHLYVNPNSPRRDRLVSVMNEVGARLVAPATPSPGGEVIHSHP